MTEPQDSPPATEVNTPGRRTLGTEEGPAPTRDTLPSLAARVPLTQSQAVRANHPFRLWSEPESRGDRMRHDQRSKKIELLAGAGEKLSAL